MIRNKRRSISAEDIKIIEELKSKSQVNNNNPTINTNSDIILQIKSRNFWKEEKTSDITNSTIKIPLSEYVTRLYLEENYYDKEAINDFIENFGVKVITLNSTNELPQEGDPKYGNSSYIFFVKHTHLTDSSSSKDIYDEYVWDSKTNQYERIGNTDIDLSGYLKTVTFNNWVNNTYTPTINNINSDISDLETNKVDVSVFNDTIDDITTVLNTKTNINDVNAAIESKLIAVLDEISSKL